MSQLVFDEKLSRQLESNYARRDFQRRRRLVHEALDARPGERLIDVGCGPGFYVAELLEQVGPAGAVTGVDNSSEMVSLAARRCDGAGNVVLREASATSLPVDDASFDAALSVQVLEFVDHVDTALAELHRALRPGGRLVLWDVDWSTVSWHSANPERMSRVLHTWDGHLSHPTLPRTLGGRLSATGFERVVMEGHAFVSNAYTPDCYGCALLPAIARYVAGRDGISEEDAQSWAAEQAQLGETGGFFFACTQFCFTAVRA